MATRKAAKKARKKTRAKSKAKGSKKAARRTKRRTGSVSRKTKETDIRVTLVLDGSGKSTVDTGLPFFDHMLEQLARHGRFDLEVFCRGDIEVDAHHTVEDVGIAIGGCVDQAVGDKGGICRYGDAHVPLDEALSLTAIDLSGRPMLVFEASFRRREIGQFPLEVVEEFFRGFANHARATVHMRVIAGKNDHHKVESLFKSFARALDEATAEDNRGRGVPSTKGVL